MFFCIYLYAFICMFVCIYLFVCLRLFVCIYLFVCLPLLKTITVQFNDTFALLSVCVCVCVCEWLATAVGGAVIATVMSPVISRQTAVPLSSSLYGRNSRVWDRLYFERHFRKIFCIPLYSWLKLWVTMLNKWYIYIYIYWICSVYLASGAKLIILIFLFIL